MVSYQSGLTYLHILPDPALFLQVTLKSMDPILILVGEDSELPCLRSPSVSAEHTELRWFRNPFSPAVLVHREGQELEEEQALEYQGR